MSAALTSSQLRQPFEAMSAWANRLRLVRIEGLPQGEYRRKLESLEWIETPGGDLRLQPIRYPQSKLDLG